MINETEAEMLLLVFLQAGIVVKGICSLIRGMKAKEIIARLKGITCGNKPTSCPDQLATALQEMGY